MESFFGRGRSLSVTERGRSSNYFKMEMMAHIVTQSLPEGIHSVALVSKELVKNEREARTYSHLFLKKTVTTTARRQDTREQVIFTQVWTCSTDSEVMTLDTDLFSSVVYHFHRLRFDFGFDQTCIKHICIFHSFIHSCSIS